MPKEEGDIVREYTAMHEEHFLSSWWKEVRKDKEERVIEIDQKTKEEVSKKRTREEEKEENETVIVKRRCVNLVSTEAAGIFSQGEDSESCGNSWGDPWDDPCGLWLLMCVCPPPLRWLSVPKMSPQILIGNLLNRSPFLSPKSVPTVLVENQEDMSYEGTPVKAPPTSRRMLMPPTPQQSSHSSMEVMQWQTEMEVQGSSWAARERLVIANMEQYLNESDCMKLEIEALELPLGPEDSEF